MKIWGENAVNIKIYPKKQRIMKIRPANSKNKTSGSSRFPAADRFYGSIFSQ